MSGKAKRTFYNIFSAVLLAAAFAGGVLMWWFSPRTIWVAAVAVAVYVVIQPSVLIHELGHVLVGKLCGMKFVSLKTGYLLFDWSKKFRVRFLWDSTAGSSAFFPKSTENVRERVLATTVGGAAVNFLVGAILFVLYFVLPYHEALLIFAFFAPFNIAEGISALIPATFTAGKTDGEVLHGLLKRAPEEEVMLAVLTAQGVLYRGGFAEIERSVLFGTPTVREDLPAYHALLLLQIEYLLAVGEEGASKEIYRRLVDAAQDASDEEWAEIDRIGKVFDGGFVASKSPLAGINELETRLERKKDLPSGRSQDQ